MSKMVRRILIKVVSSAITGYIMQVIKLPFDTLMQLEQAHCQFLWGDDSEQQTMHGVCWDVVCAPEALGGLGKGA